MPDAVIETFELSKNYGRVEALNRLNLAVPAGSIYGFLGRNGAGKTTTMKLLLGMARPSSGQGRVLGARIDLPGDSVSIRRRTGFVSEEKGMYDYMKVEQLMRFTRGLFPRWRADLEQKYLRLFELPPERKVKALSKGMRTKLALLLALAQGADLLILDEPTSGLDPVMTEEVLQVLIAHVAGEEQTIFFSSHQITEVEQIADHVAIIERGRLVLDGALEDLKTNYRRVNLVFDHEAPHPSFRAGGVEQVRAEGRTLSLLASRNVEQIVSEARDLNVVSVDVVPVSLKEIFMETVREAETSGR